MDDGNSTRSHALWRPVWVALALAAAAAVEIALEASTERAHPAPELLRGRVAPALLWVAVVPVVMWTGARFPARPGRRLRDAMLHGVAFSAWFASTNLLLRMPAVARLGWIRVLADTWAGMVRYLPTAVLLWAVLAWMGRARHAGVERESRLRSETRSPSIPESASAADEPATPATLPLPGLNRIRLAPLASIRYLEADGDHVRVHTVDHVHRVRGRLSEFERKLASTGAFVRIHRSHVVNLGHLREVQPFRHGDYVAVMSDGAELRIPRTRRRALARILGRSAPA